MRLIDADALIEKCGDWYVEEGTESGFIGTLKNLLATQPTIHPEPHWIPVTERLPDISKSVLICDIEGDIYLGHRTRYGDYYPDFYDDRIKNVTAWMPLPEPMRMEKQSKSVY